MNRARYESHVHVVAPGPGQAAERLSWAWGQQRRQTWTLDRERARTLAELRAEHSRLASSVPADVSAELGRSRQQLAQLGTDVRNLNEGTGRWAGTAAGEAARAARAAAIAHEQATEMADGERHGRWARRKARRELDDASTRLDAAVQARKTVGEPEVQLLAARRRHVAPEVARLEKAQHAHEAFLAEHREVPGRIARESLLHMWAHCTQLNIAPSRRGAHSGTGYQ